MSDEPVDYEDLTSMQLDPDALAALVEPGGECIFNWTNSQGYPVGVVVADVWRDGKFWTTCADRPKRVPALKKRPQSGVVINRGGKTAFVQGRFDRARQRRSRLRRAEGMVDSTLSGVTSSPDDEYRQAFSKFLDSPHRVIIETEANLVVAFDTVKFAQFTNEAIAAGQAELTS